MRVVKVDLFLAAKAATAWSLPGAATDGQDHHSLGQAARVWGLQIGAQVTDFVFVLNNRDAVQAFSRGGNVTLGQRRGR